MALIEAKNLEKIYIMGDTQVHALRGVTLAIEKGEFVSIMGPSGSGKSTFMNILGCLDIPSSGEYLLDGVDVASLDPNELADIRNQKIGFVFQGFNLLSKSTALENVELPMIYAGVGAKERKKRAMEALEWVGLAKRAEHFPNQLSGGQQQRVAIARAIVNQAPILLADEPTGSLDTKTGAEIMELFTKLNLKSGITIILITHEPFIAEYSQRIIRFKDGMVVADEVPTHG